jgi:probable F420-dependent oxidoreductase
MPESTVSPPQLSVSLTTFSAEDPGGWEKVLEHGRAADTAGIDRVVVSDHVAYGERLEEYGKPSSGGVAGGKQPTGPDGHWLEPLTFLSVLCGRTRRVRLGTNILQAALRRPSVLAKTAATLDVLSGGRLDLGVGVGWQREEYEVSGLRFEGRGKLLDQTLEVCQTLWREQRASYDGPGLAFADIHQMPKPLQPGGVPFWVSGRLNAAVSQRLARFGSGWIPWGEDAADLTAAIPRMRDAVAAAGRDPAGIGVVGTLRVLRGDDGASDLGRSMEPVPDLVAAGVTDFRVGVALPAGYDETVDLLSAVVAEFRSVTGRG